MDFSKMISRGSVYSRLNIRIFFNFLDIYGGALLGVRSPSGLSFYDWETTELIRRIEIQPKNVFWSDNGELCCIATDDSYYVLKYSQTAVNNAMENKDENMTADGIEDAFEPLSEIEEVIKTGVWVGDCFIYTNSGWCSCCCHILKCIWNVFPSHFRLKKSICKHTVSPSILEMKQQPLGLRLGLG